MLIGAQNIREIVPIDSPDFGRVFNVTIGAMMVRSPVNRYGSRTYSLRRSAASTRPSKRATRSSAGKSTGERCATTGELLR